MWLNQWCCCVIKLVRTPPHLHPRLSAALRVSLMQIGCWTWPRWSRVKNTTFAFEFEYANHFAILFPEICFKKKQHLFSDFRYKCILKFFLFCICPNLSPWTDLMFWALNVCSYYGIIELFVLSTAEKIRFLHFFLHLNFVFKCTKNVLFLPPSWEMISWMIINFSLLKHTTTMQILDIIMTAQTKQIWRFSDEIKWFSFSNPVISPEIWGDSIDPLTARFCRSLIVFHPQKRFPPAASCHFSHPLCIDTLHFTLPGLSFFLFFLSISIADNASELLLPRPGR